MRIGIDARLNAYRSGGIAEYTRQLMAALVPLASYDELVFLQHSEHLRPLVVAPNTSRRSIFTPPHHRFEQFTLPAELLPLRLSLLHSPDFIAPIRRSFPAVVTVHDLAFIRFPDILDDDARRYYGQVRQAVQGSEGVIAVSEATRRDMAELLGCDPATVTVIHEAAGPEFGPRELPAAAERLINGQLLREGTFLLFVSTLEPRKNLPMLLQALRICLDRDPAVGYRLVVVGKRGWRYEGIFEAVRQHRLADHVLFLDSVARQDLAWLYNACRLYANPSRYEGFGLPLLEAMACGAACLASNVSSLPEIAGAGALLLPAHDAGAWAAAIERLWKDEAARVALGEQGLRRAREFSWRRAARETLTLYRRVAEAGRTGVPLALPGTAASQPPYELPSVQETALVEALAPEVLATPLELVAPLPAVHIAEVAELHQEAVARPCLRCETPLVPDELQGQLVLRTSGGQRRVPRLWLCPHCAYAELVVELVED